MKLVIFTIGNKDSAEFAPAISLYTERLSRTTKVEWHKIPHSKATQKDQIIEDESQTLLRQLPSEGTVILLDERGTLLSSPALAEYVQKQQNLACKNLVFIIGGSYGVSQSVQKRADLVLSLGPMVFPHQLVRVMLSEQLYRAYEILRGSQYHHS